MYTTQALTPPSILVFWGVKSVKEGLWISLWTPPLPRCVIHSCVLKEKRMIKDLLHPLSSLCSTFDNRTMLSDMVGTQNLYLPLLAMLCVSVSNAGTLNRSILAHCLHHSESKVSLCEHDCVYWPLYNTVSF